MKNQILRVSLFVCSVFIVAGFLSWNTAIFGHDAKKDKMNGMDANAHEKMAGGEMAQDLDQLSGRELEIKFLQEMIKHHQSAVEMAKIVKGHTKRPELLELSNDIISKQNKEIDQMKDWLDDWYKESATGSMKSMSMKSVAKLKKAEGQKFDLLFLKEMIQHHQQAVDMSQVLQKKTDRKKLLKFGKNIVKDQTKEIQQMKDWGEDWRKS